MIDRRDIAGLAVAAVGHAGLVALVILFAPRGTPPPRPANAPIQVTLSDEVGLVSAAPDPSEEVPAPAAQGDGAPPETAVPDENPDAVKEPPVKEPRRDQQTQQKGGRGPGLNLNPNSFQGPAQQDTEGKGEKEQATMTGAALANITSAILRQVQPCADRQVLPAPEASQIVAVVQLRLKPTGALESLRIVDHKGVTDANRRYVPRVDDAVEAIFAGCLPIRGLPPELYDVQRGWRSLKFNYNLTG